MTFLVTEGGDGSSLLLKAAQRLERLDLELARDTYLDAWGAALLARRNPARSDLLDVSRAARSAPRPDGPRRPADLLLDSSGRTDDRRPRRSGTPARGGDEDICRRALRGRASLRWGWLAVVPTFVLWDEKSTRAICVRQQDAVREAGALARLPLDWGSFGWNRRGCGDFAVPPRPSRKPMR